MLAYWAIRGGKCAKQLRKTAMRVFLDATSLLYHPCGISVYLTNLAREMCRLCQELSLSAGMATLWPQTHWRYWRAVRRLLPPGAAYRPRMVPPRLSRWFSRLGTFAGGDFDLAHFPQNGWPAWTPFRELPPCVMTVHDVIPFSLGTASSDAFRRAAAQLALAKRVITVSEFSKREILRFFSVAPEKITVIPCAPQWENMEVPGWRESRILEKLGLVAGGFFLAVGIFSPHKNHAALLEAYSRYCRAMGGEAKKLVLVGSTRVPGFSLGAAIAANPRIIQIERTSPTDLRKLYDAARGFFQVSKIEGFGIPLLEAMACGCPACYAQGSSLDEIGRDAALRVVPDDIDGITEAFCQLEAGGAGIDGMAAQARAIAATYTWENAARATLATYRAALG